MVTEMLFNQPTLTVDSMGRLTGLPDKVRSKIIEYFTIDNPEYLDAVKRNAASWNLNNIPKKQKFFRIEKDALVFPRGATRQIFALCKKDQITLRIDDQRIANQPLIGIEFTGKLRDYQKAAAVDALKQEFGIIEASTGSGKTVMACYLIVKRACTSLIVVPTKELLYQWKDRLQQFTNIETVGLIGDGNLDVQPITVAIINSLTDCIPEIKDKFSYIIVDEAHRAASSMYVTGPLSKLPTRMMTGLSATMFRNDGREKVLHWFMGAIVHSVDPETLREVNAVMRPLIVQKATRFSFKKAQENYQEMISTMVEDKDRNALIAREVVLDVQNKEHGVALVVSDRTVHLENLKDLIRKQIPESKIALLTGKTSPGKRKKITENLAKGKITVLLSTLQLIGEGFDCEGLDSLHLTTPVTWKGRIIQTVGRVLRPRDGKQPVVVDYVDLNVGLLEHRAGQRLKIFEKEIFGWKVMVAPWEQRPRGVQQQKIKAPTPNCSYPINHPPNRKNKPLQMNLFTARAI